MFDRIRRLGRKAVNGMVRLGNKVVNPIGRMGRKIAPRVSKVAGAMSAAMAVGGMALAATGVGAPLAVMLEGGAAATGGIAAGSRLLTSASCYSQYKNITDPNKRLLRKTRCESGLSKR